MTDMLSPDTTLALINASQNDTVKAAKKLSAADQDKVAEAAKEFEAVFITEMMKPMFEGIETAAPFGGGKGEEIFRGFMLQEYGKMVAETGSVGIAAHVKQEMIRMQGADPEILDLDTLEAEIAPPQTSDDFVALKPKGLNDE